MGRAIKGIYVVPYRDEWTAEKFRCRMGRPWIAKYKKIMVANDPKVYIGWEAKDLQKLFDCSELGSAIQSRIARTRKDVDVRPIVRTYLRRLIEFLGKTWGLPGSFQPLKTVCQAIGLKPPGRKTSQEIKQRFVNCLYDHHYLIMACSVIEVGKMNRLVLEHDGLTDLVRSKNKYYCATVDFASGRGLGNLESSLRKSFKVARVVELSDLRPKAREIVFCDRRKFTKEIKL